MQTAKNIALRFLGSGPLTRFHWDLLHLLSFFLLSLNSFLLVMGPILLGAANATDMLPPCSINAYSAA